MLRKFRKEMEQIICRNTNIKVSKKKLKRILLKIQISKNKKVEEKAQMNNIKQK